MNAMMELWRLASAIAAIPISQTRMPSEKCFRISLRNLLLSATG